MSPSPHPQTDIILNRLAQLHPKLIDLSLGRIQRLLAKLGSPEQAVPPVVHVAGTNGKGSLIAYLRACLEAAGYRVHAYTSPHLVRFHERIRRRGELIEDSALQLLLEEVETANQGQPITQFEITTAAAFKAFADTPADILLLETGLGGLYDATNVIAKPRLTAITPIDFDHQDFLGPHLTGIALEKAGILKPECPAVIGPQQPEALSVLEARAAILHAPLSRHGREWYFERTNSGFCFYSSQEEINFPKPRLIGPHQIANAATAVACLKALHDFDVSAQNIKTGLTQVEWPARLQQLNVGPLSALLSPNDELWLDGGHNPHGATAIAAWANERQIKLDLILAMKNNKDLSAYLKVLKPVAKRLIGISIPGDSACHTPAAIKEAALDLGIEADIADTAKEALLQLKSTSEPHHILICGSLYLAGYVLAENS